MTYNIVDPDFNDQIISTHKTEGAALRALDKATLRAKANLGSTARTTLEIREVELTEDQCDRIAERIEYQGYISCRVFTDGTGH